MDDEINFLNDDLADLPGPSRNDSDKVSEIVETALDFDGETLNLNESSLGDSIIDQFLLLISEKNISTVKYIELSTCEISDMGVLTLFLAISAHANDLLKNLEMINLESNFITDESIEVMLETVDKCLSLKTVKLAKNQFVSSSKKADLKM